MSTVNTNGKTVVLLVGGVPMVSRMYPDVGTPGHIDINNHFAEGVTELINEVEVRRYHIHEPEPVIEIPVNNKPWYQQSKGRRRSY